MDGTQTPSKQGTLSKADTLNILNSNLQPRAAVKENDSDSSSADTFDILGTPRLPKTQLKKLERQNEKLIKDRGRLDAQLRREQHIVNQRGPSASKLNSEDVDDIKGAIDALEAKEMRHMANLEVKFSLVQKAYRDRPNKKRGRALDAISKVHAEFHQHRGPSADAVGYHVPPPGFVAEVETDDEDVHEPIEHDSKNALQGLDHDQGLAKMLGKVVDGMNLNHLEEDSDLGIKRDHDADVETEGSIDLGMENPFVDTPSREESKKEKKKAEKDKKKRKRESMGDEEPEEAGSEKKKKKKRKLKENSTDAGDISGTLGLACREIQEPASADSKSKSKKQKNKVKKVKNRDSNGTIENQHLRHSTSAIPAHVSEASPSKASPSRASQGTPNAFNNTPVRIFPPTNPASDPPPGRKWRFNLPKGFVANLPRFSATALGASPAHAGPDKHAATPNASSAKETWIMKGSTGRANRANRVTMTIGPVPSTGIPLSQGSPTEKRRPGRPKGSKTKNHSVKERVPFSRVSTTPIPLPEYAAWASQTRGEDLVRPVVPAVDAGSPRAAALPPRNRALPLGQQLERDRAVYQEERDQWFAAMNLPRSSGYGHK